MLTLFFEVTPKPDRYQEYLDIAAKLRPDLDAIGGCLFIDRFKSLERPGTVLSFQVWRDEAAMTAWRVHAHHHKAQTLGRSQIFTDYRLRIAQVLREEQPGKPAWQPTRLAEYNVARPPRFMMVVESTSAQFADSIATSSEHFESLYRPGEFAHVLQVPSYQAGLEVSEVCSVGGPTYRYRICEVERDYGMYDRAEAPQYYPVIERRG